MVDDPHRWTPGAEPGRLDAVAGIGHRALIGALGDGDALQPDVDPRVVHHREHRLHPAALGPDEIADALALLAERHRAGGRSVDAELVLEPDAAQIVADGEVAGGVGQELGAQEQRDALGPRRRVRQAGRTR